MMNIEQLRLGVDKFWAEAPFDNLSPLELIGWYAAKDLACFAEMLVEPEDLAMTYPETFLLLRDLESYLEEIGQLPPLALVHVLLMHERARAGLTARGKDTLPPKPVAKV